jgi:hypothetical protein
LFAWLAPPYSGGLNSNPIRGTPVPVEEPSTASTADIVLMDWGLTFVANRGHEHLRESGPMSNNLAHN